MKIFLVVGTLFPFDRLVKEIDLWVADKPEHQVTAQIGNARYQPRNMKAYPMLEAREFNRIFDACDLVITHAGMGIILKSLVASKPIIVLPRKLEWNEHTTDHQMATARALDRMQYVKVAWDNEQLLACLEDPSGIGTGRQIGEYASDQLIETLKEYISKH
jgi:UDP-N-acetylglucosamine transferase subunit ALG13